MVDKIIESIDQFVDAIYDIDQVGLQEKYLAFIDNISVFIEKMAEKGYEVNLNEDLTNIAKGMEKKDYTEVADILLYTVKADFKQLDLGELEI